MGNALTRKLSLYADLSADDVAALRGLSSLPSRAVGAREDILREGDRQRRLFLLTDGWACRYKQLVDGRRQMLSVFLPGDICDLNVYILKEIDHSIGTITPSVMVEIDPRRVEEVCERRPLVMKALWWSGLVTASIQREWTVNIGQRTAIERMGHLLCELFVRMRGIGLTSGNGCPLPLTQGDMADAMGISHVHVNRTLQALRQDGMLDLRRKRLVIHDLGRLMAACQFNPNYLHFEREPQVLDRTRKG